MKIIFTALLLISGHIAHAQSFQFIENITGTAAQSSYTRNAADTVGDEFILNCINTTSISKNVKVRMTVLSTPPGCTNDVFFCDPIACYPASIHLSVAPFSIAAEDTSFGALIPHIAAGTCCGDYAVSYCLFDVADESDSVNVMVYYTVSGNHCTNGIGELKDEYILGNAFPNPASGTVTISCRINESRNATLALYRMTGEQITEYPVPGSGTIVLDAGSLPAGIYFYSLNVNENTTGFRKLVVTK